MWEKERGGETGKSGRGCLKVIGGSVGSFLLDTNSLLFLFLIVFATGWVHLLGRKKVRKHSSWGMLTL